MSAPREIRFNSFNTRRTLPEGVRRKRGEANFLGAFVRVITQVIPSTYAYGRNFPVPGCGVADLVLCELPETTEQGIDLEGLCLSAFEMKLLDWKRALQQAYRYRYYADQSIVVLPEGAAARAIQSGFLFDALGVGLWTLDRWTGIVRKHVAPASCERPLNAAKRDKAMSALRARLVYLGQLHEEA
jgi:hypothetical protein